MTPIFYAFREREMVQDLDGVRDRCADAPLLRRVGGLKDDLPARVPEALGGGPRRRSANGSRSSSR